MPDKINLLPETVANQIAAGEVVQRPASVIKELLENSVDSGATEITLIIKDGGSSLMQVVDNGSGMSHTDARMCWERHATSKIRKADDLYAIKTFGFRGEALASIASVTMVEMETKMSDNETGTKISIEGGHIKKHEFIAAPNGTKITVKNLFYNIPARRNFLKSISVETRHIIDEFNHAALAYPEISFKFYNNDREVNDLPASDLKTRIANSLGKIKHPELLQVKEETEVVNISGFVGKPELARRRRGDQFLYVNKRFIKSAYFNFAVKSAFENIIPSDTYPVYVIFLDIDPSRIDINVSPSKTEIKFEDEKILYTIINAAVKKAIGSFMMVPELDFNSMKTNQGSGVLPNFNYSPEPKINPTYNPFGNSQSNFPKKAYGWEKLYQPIDNQSIETEKNNHPPVEQLFKKDSNPVADAVFQFSDLLIVKAYDELYLINILLARERIWYEHYLKYLDKHNSYTQQLLFPKTLEFSPGDAELLASIIDKVRSIGFDIGEFGKNTFIINGLPADLPKGDEQRIIEGLLENIKENRSKYTLSEKENIARSMAKNASMFANEILNPMEQNLLVSELFACDFPRYCPFGRPVYKSLPREEINKIFKI